MVASSAVKTLVSEFSEPLVEVCFASNDEALRAAKYLRSLSYVVRCWCDGERVAVLMEGGSDNHKLIDGLVRSGFKVMEAKRVKKSL